MRSIDKVKALIRNYIWSGEDGERQCRAKVAWDSLILPVKLEGVKLLDLAMQMQALMTKLFIRSLMPGDAPWKVLIQHRINSLRPKRREVWSNHRHFILYAQNVHGTSSDIWWATWKAWTKVRHGLGTQMKLPDRFCEKQEVMGLREDESALSIKLTWNKNKTAKRQFFLWQANSGSLSTGSWCAVMDFLGNCACCRRGPIETPEHYLSNCNTARRVWRKLSLAPEEKPE